MPGWPGGTDFGGASELREGVRANHVTPCIVLHSVSGNLPVTRLPFGVCLVAGWYRACHLTILNIILKRFDYITRITLGE